MILADAISKEKSQSSPRVTGMIPKSGYFEVNIGGSPRVTGMILFTVWINVRD